MEVNLIASARGHSGAVSSIHPAALAAIQTEGLDHCSTSSPRNGPRYLGLDAVAVPVRGRDRRTRRRFGPPVRRLPADRESVGDFEGVLLRGVERGHPLFGPACELIRAEA